MFNEKKDFILLSGVTTCTFNLSLKYTVASGVGFNLVFRHILILFQLEITLNQVQRLYFSVPGEMTSSILFVCCYKKHINIPLLWPTMYNYNMHSILNQKEQR